MAAARQNEMNERRTVVATTTRTQTLRRNCVLDTRAFRETPAELADGLGLGSVLRRRPLSPTNSVPPRTADGAGLRPKAKYKAALKGRATSSSSGGGPEP